MMLSEHMMRLIALRESNAVDFLTSLATTVIAQSGETVCMNPNHRDSDNQEDHTDSVNCLYYAIIREICITLAKGM
jgi:hypothetical protein